MKAAIVHQKVWKSNKTNRYARTDSRELSGEVNYISNLNSVTTDFFTAESFFEKAMQQYYDGQQGGTFWGVESLYIDGNSLNWGFIGTYSLAYKPYPPDIDTDEPFTDEQEQSVENSPYYDYVMKTLRKGNYDIAYINSIDRDDCKLYVEYITNYGSTERTTISYFGR